MKNNLPKILIVVIVCVLYGFVFVNEGKANDKPPAHGLQCGPNNPCPPLSPGED